MMHLRFLGGVAVESGDGTRLEASIQRRRIALLAVLAASPVGAASRDRLVGLLWPDNDGAHARNLLNQGVHALRRVLGEDALAGAGDELRLDPAWVTSDVARFVDAVASGDSEAAVRLYGGPFLDGAYLCPTADFEQWVDRERDRLARMYRAALEEFAGAAEQAGGGADAIATWRQLAAEDPLNTRVALRLCAALDREGDRAGAIRHAEAHAALLEAELGIPPGPELEPALARLREPPRSHIAAARRWATVDDSMPAVALAAPPSPLPRGRGRRASHYGLATALLVGFLLLAADRLENGDDADFADDAATIAIVPFRTSGATPELAYLGEGMVDLLAATLDGRGGPRAVDPRVSLAAWQRALTDGGEPTPETAHRVRRAIGARAVLMGEIVGDRDRLVLSARLVGAGTGTTSRATVAGPADSIAQLTERLAATLLVIEAGEAHRLAMLTSTSTEALRAFLEGRSAYRRGEFEAAAARFDDAIRIDSTFALAALGLAHAAGWYSDLERTRGVTIARRHADRLGIRDRALLEAELPIGNDRRTIADLLQAAEHAVALSPDQPDTWYRLGERLLRVGGRMGLPEEPAIRYLEHAVELDSAFLPALIRLAELSAWQGDQEAASRYGRLYLARGSSEGHGPYMRWMLAIVGGEPSTPRERQAAMDTMPLESLGAIAAFANRGGIGLDDAEYANAVRRRRPTPHRVRENALANSSGLALNRGRPSEAAAYLDEAEREPYLLHYLLRDRLKDALYWDGDRRAAAGATARLESLLARIASDEEALRDRQLSACMLEQYRLWQGDTSHVAETLALLHSTPEQPTATVRSPEFCIQLLRALHSVLSRAPEADREIRRFERLLAAGPPSLPPYAHLALARMHELRGRPGAGLDALRRRRRLFPDIAVRSTSLREEGRLAALAGDTAGALRAYRQYLALVDSPEESLRPLVEHVATEVEGLSRSGDRR